MTYAVAVKHAAVEGLEDVPANGHLTVEGESCDAGYRLKPTGPYGSGSYG